MVGTKPWIHKAETVVEYLSRYTHRTAISDSRIGAITEDEVEVSYKDYQDNGRWKTLYLPGEELIRRFLLHARFSGQSLPKEKLAKISQLLGLVVDEQAVDKKREAKNSDWLCPICHKGHR